MGSSGSTLLASLTGTGVPPLTFSTTTLAFGNLDIGATSAAQPVVITNSASGPVTLPGFSITSDFKISTSTCPGTLASGTSCTLSVVFNPTTTGPRTGTLTPNANSPGYSTTQTTLTGNGVDFTLVETPTSGTVIAGNATTSTIVTTAIAGFAAPVTATCSTTAPGTSCTLSVASFTPAPTTTLTAKFSTTSQYVIIGYGSVGGTGYLCVVGAASALLLLITRRRSTPLLRNGLLALLLAVGGLSLSGCSGKQPARNSVYTPPGTYAYTVTETDGFLVRSATFSLTVTAK